MDQFTAHLDRGWDLISRGDLAGAMLSAQKSLELDAESPEAHNLIGYIFAVEGNAEEALGHYKQAIDLDETFVEALLNAAEVMIHPIHDFKGAIDMVDDALDLAQDDEEIADAMLLKVDALLHGDDREGAKRAVARLPSGPFENPQIEFLIGRAMYEVGDVEGAGPHLEAALGRDAKHAEARYYLGLVLEARGDEMGATLAFVESRQLDLHAPQMPWSVPRDEFEGRLRGALALLPEPARLALEGAPVIVTDVPGAEVVADGVDPRVPLLLDQLSEEGQEPKVGRVFVYQRNIERASPCGSEPEQELASLFEQELVAAFPALASGDATPGPERAP